VNDCIWPFICATVIVAVLAVGCDGRDSRDGLLRDADGNAYVLRDMLDGRTWITQNLSVARPDSYCYGGWASECLRFGRLYTWASAAEACRLLGSEWRLPTDDEWRQLAKGYGGVRGDSEDDGKAAYTALLDGGVSGFHALLGGDASQVGTMRGLKSMVSTGPLPNTTWSTPGSTTLAVVHDC
jgi:uncharacterized protein (TIGR02145 family)